MSRIITYPEIQNLDDKEKAKHYSAAYRAKNPERMLWRSAKCRAAKRGTEFTIQISDINIPKLCPILGIELQHNPEVGGLRGGKDNSPSLDRIDNNKGYIPGNIQVVSNKANSMKSTANRSELIAFAAWVMKEYT